MQVLRSSLAALLVLALFVSPASAGEEAPVLEARNFDLLPLNDLEKQEFARDHQLLAQRVMVLNNRMKRLRQLRAGRKDPNDSGGKQLEQQIRQIEEQMAPLMRNVVEANREAGIDDRLLRHVAKAPRGPLRTARYAMGLVLYVEDVPEKQRALLEHAIPRVQGALLALHGQKERLQTPAGKAGLSDDKLKMLVSGIDARIRQTEKRFWRLVDYVVPEAQRAAVHRVLPNAHQQIESVIQHIYALPGLTPSQGVRIKALLTEIEAEASPENATVRRMQAKARDKKLEADERRSLQKKIQEAQHRLVDLRRFAVVKAKEILTEAQWVTLEAIPPRVSAQDRRQTSPQVLDGVDLTDAQWAQLGEMRRELVDVRNEYRERRLKAAAKAANYGPDSPQMAGMQMEMAAIEADGNVIQRRFNGRLFLELLTQEQTTAWILGLGTAKR